MSGCFSVYKSKDGYRWRLRAANGRIVAVGEAYTRESSAYRALDAVRRAADGASKPKVKELILFKDAIKYLGGL